MVKKSIIYNENKCFNCGSQNNLHNHHIFNGAYRNKSDEDKLVIPLCAFCHNYTHTHNQELINFKKLGQKAYLLKIGNNDQFLKRYGKNYLDENEIKDWEKRGKNYVDR